MRLPSLRSLVMELSHFITEAFGGHIRRKDEVICIYMYKLYFRNLYDG